MHVSLKTIYLYILLIAFTVKPLYNLCFLAYYQLNVESITEAFCENKEKVELSCNGKCHLAKQLQSDTSSQDENTTLRIPVELFSLVFFEKSSHSDLYNNQFEPHESVRTKYVNSYMYSFHYECFKPPIA